MSKQDDYIAGQKASGIEVGDTVRVVRKAKSGERGWLNCWASGMAVDIERVVVGDLGANGLTLDDKNYCDYPYFVLQIIKKADGSVPVAEQITAKTGEHDMSTGTQNFECKAVLLQEGKRDDGGVSKSVVCSKDDLFEADEVEAKRRFSMIFAERIQEAEKKGKVQILCSPFCG